MWIFCQEVTGNPDKTGPREMMDQVWLEWVEAKIENWWQQLTNNCKTFL